MAKHAAMAHAATSTRARASARNRPSGRSRPQRRSGSSGIRWDRVARASLLAVLGVIVLLYISPIHRFFAQSRTADDQRTELRQLQREHARLKKGIAELRTPQAVDVKAREIGMVKQGERAYVIENLPRR